MLSDLNLSVASACRTMGGELNSLIFYQEPLQCFCCVNATSEQHWSVYRHLNATSEAFLCHLSSVNLPIMYYITSKT